MKELSAGMAETTNLTEDDLEILYEGPIFSISLTRATPGCSFLAAWGDYTRDGSVVLSRNYDLPDLLGDLNQYYTLVVYNPTDNSNGVATFGPAGSRPETLMNSAGLFIADDNAATSSGGLVIAGRPDLVSEFFRLMLDYSDMDGLDAGIGSLRPDGSWIVNAAGQGIFVRGDRLRYQATRGRRGYRGCQPLRRPVVASGCATAGTFNHALQQPARPRRTAPRRHRWRRDGQDSRRTHQRRGVTFRHDLLEGYPYSSTHQVTFVLKSRTLWIKVVDREWQKVELGPLFASR